MPYACPVCGKTYRELRGLKAHFRKIHLNSTLTRYPVCNSKLNNTHVNHVNMILIRHCQVENDEKHEALLYLLYTPRTSLPPKKRRKVALHASKIFSTPASRSGDTSSPSSSPRLS